MDVNLIERFLWFICGFLGGLLSILLIGPIIVGWRHLIWRSKGRVFRVVKEDDTYYPEKRFLWFFYVREAGLLSEDDIVRYYSKEGAVKYIHRYLPKKPSKEVVDVVDLSKEQ